jgi:hypothetical protein
MGGDATCKLDIGEKFVNAVTTRSQTAKERINSRAELQKELLNETEQKREQPTIVTDAVDGQSKLSSDNKTLSYRLFATDEARELFDCRDLAAEQSRDDQLRQIMAAKIMDNGDGIEPAFQQEWDQLKLVNGLLVRCCVNGGDEIEQIVLPQTLQLRFVTALHTETGHQGRDKTAERVCRLVWFPRWRSVVKTVCDTCLLCAEFGHGKPPRQGEMQTLEVDEPMYRLAIDLVGPNPRTARGNVFILTVLDAFSRYLIAIPIRNKSATTVAAALHRNVFAIWGLPRQLYSDRGGEFCNQLMDSICMEYGIRHLRTSPERPASNGRCERVHKGIHSMLAKAVRSDHRDWDLVLPATTFAYNSTLHSSTGYSPNQLMMGRQALGPVDLLLKPTQRQPLVSVKECVDKLQQRMIRIFRDARRRSASQAVKRKNVYDRRVRAVRFNTGQTVLVRRDFSKPGLNQKWRLLYAGPFVVLEAVGPVNYRVQRTTGGRTYVVHVDRMRAWRVGGVSLSAKLASREASGLATRMSRRRRPVAEKKFGADLPWRRGS